ncbi:acetoin ABC transporter permease [Lactiplantibacillus paraplantarum]|uniref:acetoin ABC transporter permease n=1 Tax=Lactiplantibacillus paraplantarum TaxID=60520 RepID=UPI000E09DD2E|nr:acetoin ABC transporter permease [Lactiplantibacillus paraplantarum]RDG11558.1 acetoin ABC transporter permease [Lactiplantibacillus paraplantarum]
MTKRKLWQLLWRHYRTLLLTAGVILLLAGIKEGYSVTHNPSLYIAAHATNFTLTSVTGVRTIASLGVSFVLGILLFLTDNFTNFDQYLFSLPVTRRQIYRRKIGLLIGTLISGYVVMEVSFGLIAWRAIVNRHVQINWNATLYEDLETLAAILTLSLLAATFGLWVGHVFASVLAAFIFTCSLVFAYDGLINVIAGLTGLKYRQVDVLGRLQGHQLSGVLTILALCLVISGCLYWLDQWAFEHLSLESSQDFFRFPQWRGAVLGFSIGYLIVAISCSQFGTGILGMVTDNYRAQMPLLAGIIMALVVAYLTWSLGRWFLYRPDKFRDVWTFKKLA